MIFRDDIVPTRLQADLYHSTIHHSLLLDCSALVVLCIVCFIVILYNVYILSIYYSEGDALHGTYLLSRSHISPLGHCLHALIYLYCASKKVVIQNLEPSE